MFEICKDINYVSTKRELVRRLLLSFNEPMVAPSSHTAQPAQAYMAALKDGQRFSVYICLYLTAERTTILYKYTDIINNADECRAAEEEAFQFMEGMGFIIDDSNFESLDISEQEKLLLSVPLFTPPAKVTDESVEEQPIKKEVVGEEDVAVIEKREAVIEERPISEEFAVMKEADREYVEVVSENADTVRVEEKPAPAEENIPIQIETKAPEKREEIEEKWGTELFLSKFRMRAAAERMKK